MEGIESHFEALSDSIQKVSASFADAGAGFVAARPIMIARQRPSSKFRCAKCGKYKPVRMKAIVPRRTGGPGVVPWCLSCVVRQTATWEYLDR